MIRLVCAAVAAVGCVFATGCGDTRPVVSQTPVKDALAEIGQLLKSLSDEKRKPPGKLTELGPVEPMLPTAASMIRDGTIVYIWGTSYAASGEKVAAYEKNAETEGGWVLLQDGTIKSMKTDEFRAAKAK